MSEIWFTQASTESWAAHCPLRLWKVFPLAAILQCGRNMIVGHYWLHRFLEFGIAMCVRKSYKNSPFHVTCPMPVKPFLLPVPLDQRILFQLKMLCWPQKFVGRNPNTSLYAGRKALSFTAMRLLCTHVTSGHWDLPLCKLWIWVCQLHFGFIF